MRSISLDNIVELSATFLQLKDEERALPWYRRGGTKKRQIDTLQGERDALKQKYVDQLLNQFDRVNVVPKMNDSLSLLRQKADSSWYPAIDLTKDDLIPYLQIEANRNPSLRKASKILPPLLFTVFLIAVVGYYFTVRITSRVEITEPSNSETGMNQRATAFLKAANYDRHMRVRVRKGGFLQPILSWPIKPTVKETEGAEAFAGLVLTGQEYLTSEKLACVSLTIGTDSRLSDDQIRFVEIAAEYVNSLSTPSGRTPAATLGRFIQEKYPCS